MATFNLAPIADDAALDALKGRYTRVETVLEQRVSVLNDVIARLSARNTELEALLGVRRDEASVVARLRERIEDLHTAIQVERDEHAELRAAAEAAEEFRVEAAVTDALRELGGRLAELKGDARKERERARAAEAHLEELCSALAARVEECGQWERAAAARVASRAASTAVAAALGGALAAERAAAHGAHDARRGAAVEVAAQRAQRAHVQAHARSAADQVVDGLRRTLGERDAALAELFAERVGLGEERAELGALRLQLHRAAQQRTRKIECRLRHRMHRSTAWAWGTLTAFVRQRKRGARRRQMQRRVLHRIATRTASMGWQALVAHAARQRQQRALGSRVVARLRLRRAAAAFDGWSDALHRRAAARDACRRIVARCAHVRSGAAFSTWLAVHRERERVVRLVTRGVRRWKTRHCARGWCALRAHVANEVCWL